MFSDHSRIQLETSNTKIAGKSPNIWRSSSTLLNSPWIKKKFFLKIGKTLASWGCYYPKLAQIGWLKQQNFILSKLWTLEVCDQFYGLKPGCCGMVLDLGSPETPSCSSWGLRVPWVWASLLPTLTLPSVLVIIKIPSASLVRVHVAHL